MKPPSSWNLSKLHRVLHVRRGFKNIEMREKNLLSLSFGRIVNKDIEAPEGLLPESFETYQIVEPGNIILRLTDLQNDKRSLRQGIVVERGIITSAYDALEPGKCHEPRYWFYALLALDLAKYYYSLGGGVRQSINFADFPNEWIATPDLATQKAIAAFLDAETARIDALIEKKERLLALTVERRDALIDRAITAGGLRTRLGHHVSILPGYAFPSSDFSLDQDDVRLLRGANVAPGSIRWDDVVYWPAERLSEVKRFSLSAGDIVLGMDRPWISGGIRVAELTDSDTPALLLQRVCRIRPLKSLRPQFLKLLLASRRFLAHFEPILTGVSVPHISGEQIGAFRFDLPELAAQNELTADFSAEDAKMERIRQTTELSIDRLREFRASLITAAVTGQIDPADWRSRGKGDQRLERIEAEMAS